MQVYLQKVIPVANLTIPSLGFKWIDIINPSEDELKAISVEYYLHQYTLRDCLEPDHLPKHEDLGDIQFVITRILNKDQVTQAHTTQEISSKIAIFFYNNCDVDTTNIKY